MAKAMVKPTPEKPISAAARLKVKEFMEMFGVDRAYTILSASHNRYVIHLEGDTRPRTITFEDEKPVLS